MIINIQSKSFGASLIHDLKQNLILRILVLSLSFFLVGSVAHAEDEKKPEESSTWEQDFIRSNLYMANFFDAAAEKIDLFLSRRDKTEHRNETSVRIINSSNSTEGQAVTNYVYLNVNLKLPNLEEYWQLKFSSYNEEEANRGVQRGYLRTAPIEQNYGATVGLFRKLGNVRTSFQPRIELQDPLKVSHSLRFDSSADLKTYVVNPKLEFFASPDKGTGIYGGINVKFILSKYYDLLVVNEGEYQEKSATFSSNSGFSVQQVLNDKQSLAYNLFFNSNSRPAYHLESYSFSVSWNEVIYKKILDYQIVPHLDFPREYSFKGQAGLTLNVSINF